MTKDELLSLLSIARSHKTKGEFAEAIKSYDSIYQKYVDGYHQYYDFARYTTAKYDTSLLIDDAAVPSPVDWKTELAFFFHDILNEYTECLILSHNPDFSLEANEVYKKMTSHNTTYKLEYIKGKPWQTKYKMTAKEPYPYNAILLPMTHVFKSGSWKDLALFEIEMANPGALLKMVESIPTEKSESKLDLAIDQKLFLSKYRDRNTQFYSALETNYAKISAMRVWHVREEEEDLRHEREIEEAEEMGKREIQMEREILEAANDELQSMMDETDGFSDWNMDR